MPAQPAQHITVDDDTFVQAIEVGDPTSRLIIRDAQHFTIATLHFTPAAAHEVRDAMIRITASLDARAIEAAGFEAPEAPVARSFGEALTIVRSFSTPGVTS